VSMQLDLTGETAVRWAEPDAAHLPLLKEGGITAVVAAPNAGFEKACVASGIRFVSERQVRLLGIHEAGKAQPGEIGLIKTGLWPGTRNPQATVASATRSLWMDQNCYLVGYLRALYPSQPAVLAYLPDADAGVEPGRVIRYESHELALVEAWVAGGNYVLAPGARYREGLLKGAPDALAAWRRLGKTAAWLRANVALFRQPALPVITVLVDRSDLSLEIANLCYRFNVSPALLEPSNLPAADPRRRLVIAAAGIAAPQGAIRSRILAHATAGATVVADERGDKAWWRAPGIKLLSSYPDREDYACGKGRIVAYREPVSDPGEFALDLIDYATQKRRPARAWNSQGALVLATSAPKTGPVTGAAALHVINYSQPTDQQTLVLIQGNYMSATVLRPEAVSVPLKISPRGTASEVALPGLGRVATVIFR
jgi:hypothetical protein